MGVVLLVCFVVVLLLWLLSLLGAVPDTPRYSPWLAFFAVAVLGVVVFVGRF